ncbi:MAG TPA: Ppx/GppA phosphatase family protein [Solirubrobacterales bacterium]|nr:Ppx/GppA phosphatase family protein [Solirubrobacterales bacterium]
MRVAVVDIGSNSTRLLVADVDQGRVEELDRRSTVTRLGRGVDTSGQLSIEGIEAVCAVLADYIAAYRELGAERVSALATSAVRDAANSAMFLAELRERFALDARLLDGDAEARLTYAGACADHPVDGRRTLVVDIGGGSTELIVGDGPELGFHASLQAGVVRHTERHLQSDPPTAAELEALAGDVRELIADALDGADAGVEDGIAVAGTPTSLAAIDQRLDPYDRDRVHGHRLGLETIQRLLSQLASKPLTERLEVTGLHPGRAPTIVAGVVILIQVMRAFGLDEIEVSEHDILWGAALEAAEEATER